MLLSPRAGPPNPKLLKKKLFSLLRVWYSCKNGKIEYYRYLGFEVFRKSNWLAVTIKKYCIFIQYFSDFFWKFKMVPYQFYKKKIFILNLIFYSNNMLLQILILIEKVKKSTYVIGEHIEGLLSWAYSLNIVYKLLFFKLEKLENFRNKRIFLFRNLPIFFRYGKFHFKPYSPT